MYINYDNNGCHFDNQSNGLSINIDINNKTITNINVTYCDVTTIIDKSTLSSCNYTMINIDTVNNKNMWLKINHYMNTLSNEQLTKINHQCEVYQADYKKTFIYGFCTYLSFFELINNKDFINLLPFTFDVPCSLDEGNCCDFNMIHYLAMPFNTIISIIDHDCMLYHYINHILTFIDLWSDLFSVGPLLDYNLLNKLNYDTIKGVSKYSINKVNNHIKNIKSYIDSEIKSSLKELTSKSEVDSFDHSILQTPILQKLKFENDDNISSFSSFDDDNNDRIPVLTLQKHIY